MRIDPLKIVCFSICVFSLFMVNRIKADEPVTFYAMGDVPYAPAEFELLERQLAELPADATFVVHVGDIKRGAHPCDAGVYLRVADILKKSHAPVFILPGDNEWNDCVDPDSAWKFWVEYFMKLDEFWKHGMVVDRQGVRPENFAFVRNKVLFMGINLVGGRVHDKTEWKLRHQQDLTWVTDQLKKQGEAVYSIVLFGHAAPRFDHSDFFLPMVKAAEVLGKPFLYIHGDGHTWVYDQPFTPKNIYRVQVDQGGIASPVKVSVTGDPKEPFVFDRRK